MPMPPNPLNLKQRLTALSLSHSSPASPHGDELPPRSQIGTKRRTFFNSLWMKRQHHEVAANGEHRELETVQEVISRMIFQAGVDFETRPMVVFNASALPDPSTVSYDLLLSRILSYLNLYVEADYTVVFFAAGGQNTPGWNWIWKAYRSLSRKYRKNLKRLYIVHSSFFSKMLFSLAGAIISPKFFRKLVYINTLSELACNIPLTQIDIPSAVYQENLKHEQKITLPVRIPSSIFGVPLEDLMGYDGEKGGIPRVVKDSIQFLRESGLEEEGLFRRSPQSLMLRAAQDAYDRGNVVSLETFGDLHLATVLIKKYLRDLPEPIFPERLYPIIRRCPQPTNEPTDMTSVTYVREILLPELPPCVYILFCHVLHLLHEVSLRSANNRMDAHNLTIVICPNLVKSTSLARDVMMCSVPGGPSMSGSTTPPQTTLTSYGEGKTTLGMIVRLCIQRYYEVFDEMRDRSEALPPRRTYQGESMVSTESSASASPQSRHNVPRNEDEEDIDDAMLVMPIGPSLSHSNWSVRNGRSTSPPSAWSATGGVVSGFKPLHHSGLSGEPSSGPRSMHTSFGDGSVRGAGYPYPSMSKAKSMISIEKGTGTVVGRKGSISIGRGTTRKATGAGVEAISVTAEGFFTAPSATPPVPQVQKGDALGAISNGS